MNHSAFDAASVAETVENPASCREINQCQNLTLISAGNGRFNNHVCLGSESRDTMLSYLQQVETRQQTLSEKDTLRHLPHPYVLFPQLLKPDEDEPYLEDNSCATLIENEQQSLYVNDITALVAARYIQQILLREPIESFITFCNLEGAVSVQPVPLTLENVLARLEMSS